MTRHIEQACWVDPARIVFRVALHADDPALSRLLFDALTGTHDGKAAERALSLHLYAG